MTPQLVFHRVVAVARLGSYCEVLTITIIKKSNNEPIGLSSHLHNHPEGVDNDNLDLISVTKRIALWFMRLSPWTIILYDHDVLNMCEEIQLLPLLSLSSHVPCWWIHHTYTHLSIWYQVFFYLKHATGLTC